MEAGDLILIVNLIPFEACAVKIRHPQTHELTIQMINEAGGRVGCVRHDVVLNFVQDELSAPSIELSFCALANSARTWFDWRRNSRIHDKSHVAIQFC